MNKKRIFRTIISFLIVVSLAFSNIGRMCPLAVYASNTNIPAYTVTLLPGDGTGSSIVFNSTDDGRYYGESRNGGDVPNGQFFNMEGDLWFMAPDCPDTFEAPAGNIFVGWNDEMSPGSIFKVTGNLTLTAQWAEVGNANLQSLTPSLGTLDPQFAPDEDAYNLNVPYNGVPVIVTFQGVAQDPNAKVEYSDSGDDFSDTCPSLTDERNWLLIKVTNGANEKIYDVVLCIYYTLTVTTEGEGTAKAYDRDGEKYTGGNENQLFLEATPAEGWKFKEWQLVSGDGTLKNETSQDNAKYRFNKSNAEVKAVFEQDPPADVAKDGFIPAMDGYDTDTNPSKEDREQSNTDENNKDVDPTENSDDSSKMTKKDYSSEWVDGLWYSSDGSQTYKPIGRWKQNIDGWYYIDEDGWYPQNMWQKIDGYWYFFDETGYMCTNQYCGSWEPYLKGVWWVGTDGRWDGSACATWNMTEGTWWFGDTDGWYAHSGWLKICGYWYYFDSEGWMLKNSWIGQYYVSEDGAWTS